MKKEEKVETAVVAANGVVTEDTINQYLFGSNTVLTDSQKKMFMEVAIAFQLNPFKREIYAVPYEEKRWSGGEKVSYNPPRYKLSIITGYEVYLNRAEETGLLDGWEMAYDGKTCTAIIYRKDWSHPFKHTIDIAEYDGNGPMWKTKRRTMAEKTCISQSFRRAFPEKVGRLPYTKEELPDEMTTIVDVKAVDATPVKEKAAPAVKQSTNELPPTSANEELGNTKVTTQKKAVEKVEAPVTKPKTQPKAKVTEEKKAPVTTDTPAGDKRADFNSALYPVVFAEIVKRHIDSKPDLAEGDNGYIPWEDNGPDAVSKKQHDLISKLMLSSHVREKDKLNCLRALSSPLTKAKASEIVDYMLRTIKSVEDGVKKILDQLEIGGEGSDPRWAEYIKEWYMRLDKNSWTKIISSGIDEKLKEDLNDFLEQKNAAMEEE